MWSHGTLSSVATLPRQPPKWMTGGSSLAHKESGGTEATFRAAGSSSLLLTCTWGAVHHLLSGIPSKQGAGWGGPASIGL